MLIKKETFLSINKELKGNHYGFDNIFAIKLKKQGAKIYHIDNPVWHKGLESNKLYLAKKEAAAQTILMLYKANKIEPGSNDLLKVFKILKKLRLTKVTAHLFNSLKKAILKNLLGNNPNILLLNIYRLGYVCNIYTNGK